MSKTKKAKAPVKKTAPTKGKLVKVSEETHTNIKVEAAKKGIGMGELLDEQYGSKRS